MAQGLFLLHSDLVQASRDLLTIWQAANPVPGDVVTDHAAAVALMPQFTGYPAVVYEDATGTRHCLFNPLTLETVTAWREGIDNPPKPTVMSQIAFSKRFTPPERIAIRQAAATDPEVFDAMDMLDRTPNPDLVDPLLLECMHLLLSKGLLTQDRATAILTP